MSIDVVSIIEQIRAMTPDAEFCIRCALGPMGKGVQGYGNVGTVKSIIALAESHERLLKAVKGISHGGCTKPADWNLLDDAIAEAEELTTTSNT